MPRKKATTLKVDTEASEKINEAVSATAEEVATETTAHNIYGAIFNIQRILRNHPPARDSFEDFMETLRPLLDSQQVVLYIKDPMTCYSSFLVAHAPSNTAVCTVIGSEPNNKLLALLNIFGVITENLVLGPRNADSELNPEIEPTSQNCLSDEGSTETEPEINSEVIATQESVPEPQVIIGPINPELGRGKAIDLQSLEVNTLLRMLEVADTTQQLAMIVDGAIDGEAWIYLTDRAKFINAVRTKYVSLSRQVGSGGRIPIFEKKMKDHIAKLEEEIHEEKEVAKWNEEVDKESK